MDIQNSILDIQNGWRPSWTLEWDAATVWLSSGTCMVCTVHVVAILHADVLCVTYSTRTYGCSADSAVHDVQYTVVDEYDEYSYEI